MAAESYSIPDLANAVNDWCREHGIAPANGQAAEDLSERSLRYYRTIGLLDAPDAGGGRGYGEKHLLQLIAVRLLQARGLPLRRIRELLQSRTLEELRRIQREGLAEWVEAAHSPWPVPRMDESWRMIPIGPDHLLLSRKNEPLSPESLAAIRRILDGNLNLT